MQLWIGAIFLKIVIIIILLFLLIIISRINTHVLILTLINTHAA